MAKYYYNGVLMPEIPADVLAEYPYCWIRNNTRTGYYDLLLSQKPWYLADEDTLAKSVDATKWYQIPIASADTTEAWTFNSDYDSPTWGNESNRRIMWSNHDIPNGSATATAIYFYSTYPIPEADECYYNGVRLPAIPYNTTDTKWVILYRPSVDSYRLFGSTTPWYFYSTDAYPSTINNDGANCRAYDLSEDGKSWKLINSENNDYQIINASETSSQLLWSNHDIRNGSAISTTIYFYGNSPVAVEPGTPAERTRGYLIRSNSTLYTITDGALSALTETAVTASLFRVYGVDEIPDGALLVGLTDPEVLFWQDSEDELPVLELTVKGAPPLPQMFTSEPMDLSHESIAGISHAVVDASEDVRFAISFDGGTTWQAFDGSAWFNVSDTAPGMLASTMNAITAEQWAEVVVLESYMVRFWLPNVTAFVKSVVIHYINP